MKVRGATAIGIFSLASLVNCNSNDSIVEQKTIPVEPSNEEKQEQSPYEYRSQKLPIRYVDNSMNISFPERNIFFHRPNYFV